MKKLLIGLCLMVFLWGCSENKVNQTIIETSYYTVTEPEDWDGLYEYEVVDLDVGGYALDFYEKDSYQGEYGGFLFGIVLYPSDYDYSYLPSYEVIGMLETDHDVYNMLIEYPTDVQFDDHNADKYHALSDDDETIIKSIKVINGAKLTTNE